MFVLVDCGNDVLGTEHHCSEKWAVIIGRYFTSKFEFTSSNFLEQNQLHIIPFSC